MGPLLREVSLPWHLTTDHLLHPARLDAEMAQIMEPVVAVATIQPQGSMSGGTHQFEVRRSWKVVQERAVNERGVPRYGSLASTTNSHFVLAAVSPQRQTMTRMYMPLRQRVKAVAKQNACLPSPWPPFDDRSTPRMLRDPKTESFGKV